MGLKTTRQTLLASVQQVLTWTGQGTSGVGLLHVLVYDRYVKVWKSTVLIQDVGQKPQLLARLRAYAYNARQQGAVLAQAPLIFLVPEQDPGISRALSTCTCTPTNPGFA